jgi:BirA family biotin operon repressor/biotin-[acetyl-CoA-carboxylase] ligase
LLNSLWKAVTLFQAQGFGVFLPRWQALDLTRDQMLDVQPGGGAVVHGLGRGVDIDGALLVQTDSGLRKFQGGEVSLRLRD